MDKSLLVELLGFPATLIHGDPLVVDRWLWLRRRLPKTRNGERLLDVGCGTGAFTIGASLRGYQALGLSWDRRNQSVAQQRAQLCHAYSAKFDELDVRKLDERSDLVAAFDVVICCENIEHVIDDRKLMKDMAACLRPGGRLLLSSPQLVSLPLSSGDIGPFSQIEDGGHVRKGYSKAMLCELCKAADLVEEEIAYCSGVLSQKLTSLQRALARVHPLLAWTAILPLRVLPPLLDGIATPAASWPQYSICLEAYKPRFAVQDR